MNCRIAPALAWTGPWRALLLVGLLSGNLPEFVTTLRAEPATTQFCWAVGKYDDTVYYDEIEGREDRSESFGDFVEVMGIVHTGVQCSILDTTAYRSMRPKMLSLWRAAGLSPVHTTFLSDLDY